MCQQQLGHILPLCVLLALSSSATLSSCAHYNWGASPPPRDGTTSRTDIPDGPAVRTVNVPPDWTLDGHELAHVTIRALHRHGAPRASRLTDHDAADRLTCTLHGRRPTGFQRHHTARVVARCHWRRGADRPDIHATGSGHTTTSSPKPGAPHTANRRRTALRTAAHQALARAAAQLMTHWHHRH